MSAWLRRNPLVIGLGVAVVLLGIVLAAEVAVGKADGEKGPALRVAAAEPKLLPPLAQVAAEQAYPETANRPIFVPQRRPAPELQVAATPAMVRGQFTLAGVIVAGQNRTAMLKEKSSGRVHRVEQGKEINGMKVVQIDPQVVTLGIGEERETVPLSVGRAAGAPGPAPTAALPPQGNVAQGPFGAPPAASPFPPPQQPGQPPGAPAMPTGAPQSLGAMGGAPPFPANLQPGTPPAPVQPGAPGTPQANTAPMSAEELLARRRARRAQQTQ